METKVLKLSKEEAKEIAFSLLNYIGAVLDSCKSGFGLHENDRFIIVLNAQTIHKLLQIYPSIEDDSLFPTETYEELKKLISRETPKELRGSKKIPDEVLLEYKAKSTEELVEGYAKFTFDNIVREDLKKIMNGIKNLPPENSNELLDRLLGIQAKFKADLIKMATGIETRYNKEHKIILTRKETKQINQESIDKSTKEHIKFAERPSYLPKSLTQKEEELANILIEGFIEAVNRTIKNKTLTKNLRLLRWKALREEELLFVKPFLGGYGSMEAFIELIESCFSDRVYIFSESQYRKDLMNQREYTSLSDEAIDIVIQASSRIIPELIKNIREICGKQVREMVHEIGLVKARDIAEIITIENQRVFDAYIKLTDALIPPKVD